MQKKFRKFSRQQKLLHKRRVQLIKQFSRHPVAVPIFTFTFLLAVSGLGFLLLVDRDAPVRDTRVVIISHDGEKQTVPSLEQSVGSLLRKLDIQLGQGDRVEPALHTQIRQDDFRINIYRAVPVRVVDDGVSTYTFSAATTPRAIARQTGAQLFAEDRIATVPTANFLRDGAIGERIIIDRATPINLNIYGTLQTIRTHAKTVGELVREKGINLQASDQVLPSPETPISKNQQIFIAREGTRLESVTEQIEMPVELILDDSLAYGTTAVRQQGSPGERIVTYQIDADNPRIRSEIQSIVLREPVAQIEVRGTSLSGTKADMARAGIAESDFVYVDYIVFKESTWNYLARNPSSGAYGLCQALPGSKMASAGSDWETNPVTQLRWCDSYAKARYGSWSAAYSFWLRNHYW